MRREGSQLPLVVPEIAHPHARELGEIRRILDSKPELERRVGQDLVLGVAHPETGARGMTGSQVLRALVLKQMKGFSYEDLAFVLEDSRTYRLFCGFGAFDRVPSRSTLAENIGKVRPETLEAINRAVVRQAMEEGVESGEKVRIDATVTETNIHPPSDSEQLWDGVRVLTRLMVRARKTFGFTAFSDHTRRAKRRMTKIRFVRGKAKRKAPYRDLLKVARRVRGYAAEAIAFLENEGAVYPHQAKTLAREIRHFRGLLDRVVDQTEQRVLHGKSVPAEQKVVSLFEPHTDIIIKDGRDTCYGHKVYLNGGASGLILDCWVAEGNPADSTRVVPILERQRRIYGEVPRQACFDGAFASKENLKRAKALGVEDVAFSKKRGLKVGQMVKNSWLYQRLRNFRAGIEAVISFLKRVFGLGRCTWRGAEGFRAYVQASVLSANLLVFARHRMA